MVSLVGEWMTESQMIQCFFSATDVKDSVFIPRSPICDLVTWHIFFQGAAGIAWVLLHPQLLRDSVRVAEDWGDWRQPALRRPRRHPRRLLQTAGRQRSGQLRTRRDVEPDLALLSCLIKACFKILASWTCLAPICAAWHKMFHWKISNEAPSDVNTS